MPLIPNSPVLATPLLATPKGRQQLLMCYRDGLLNDTIAFWFPRSIDTKYGGFLHCFDHDGSVLDTDKSVWAQGRMSWMLLTLFNTLEKRSEWLEWAEQRAVMESVAPNGDIVDHFDGRLLNPGHAIEVGIRISADFFTSATYAASRFRNTGRI